MKILVFHIWNPENNEKHENLKKSKLELCKPWKIKNLFWESRNYENPNIQIENQENHKN